RPFLFRLLPIRYTMSRLLGEMQYRFPRHLAGPGLISLPTETDRSVTSWKRATRLNGTPVYLLHPMQDLAVSITSIIHQSTHVLHLRIHLHLPVLPRGCTQFR